MKNNTLLSEDKFWNIVNFLTDFKKEVEVSDVCNELNITFKQLTSFIELLKNMNYEVYFSQNSKTISAPVSDGEFEPTFSLADWIEFQSGFPDISPFDIFEDDHPERKLQICEGEENHNESILARAIKFEKVVTISFVEASNRKITLLPRKLVYLDGALCLIGESIIDQSLTCIDYNEIGSVVIEDQESFPVFSTIEINDFVSSMRSMSGTSTRLVLKILSYSAFKMNIDQQFFENPCVFNNAKGDLIWAATVEPNEKIFEWLMSLGENVEIFEASDFKLKYLNYCESRLKKLA